MRGHRIRERTSTTSVTRPICLATEAVISSPKMQRFHLFQIATVLALWGIVISTVYMLRAYRATFMGTLPERWATLVDLRRGLRIPIAILIAALIAVGFFPQTVVNIITPAIRTYFLTANK